MWRIYPYCTGLHPELCLQYRCKLPLFYAGRSDSVGCLNLTMPGVSIQQGCRCTGDYLATNILDSDKQSQSREFLSQRATNGVFDVFVVLDWIDFSTNSRVTGGLRRSCHLRPMLKISMCEKLYVKRRLNGAQFPAALIAYSGFTFL